MLRKQSGGEENWAVRESTLLAQLGTIRLWLGECLMWNGQFSKETGQPDVLSCLKQAREDLKKGGDTYREAEALVSELTARYLSGEEIEKEVEQLQKEAQTKAKDYLNLLGRIRLTQGNFSFSSLLKSGDGGGDKKQLRRMLRRYIEACDCFARTGMETNFHLAVRVLLERISMIRTSKVIKNHAVVLEELKQGLLGIWFDYSSLEAKERELRSLQEFIDIQLELPMTAETLL
jgi:hypothetical protein